MRDKFCTACGHCPTMDYDRKPDQKRKDLLKCAGCKLARYCSKECQVRDWPKHKEECKAPRTEDSWMDEFRATKEGRRSSHMGRLEFVTWEGEDEDGTKFGWGGALLNEVDLIKNRFEVTYKGDHTKMFEYWPQAYRWTCCGMSGAEGWCGCDHHGDMNNAPCTCDYCRGGKPLPTKLWNKQQRDQHRQGLRLRRGPDPRSHSPVGDLNMMLRQMFMGRD